MSYQITERTLGGFRCRIAAPKLPADEWRETIYICGEADLETICGKCRGKHHLIVAIASEDWGRDFSPWPAPALRKGETDFSGGADKYLDTLVGVIKPAIEEAYGVSPEPDKNILVGYSLGGLVTLYALYRTPAFGRAACISGSLWYDDFAEFAGREAFAGTPRQIYLSLGTGEKRSRNPRMGTVAKKTLQLYEDYCGRVEKVAFEWNAGGHFTEVEERFAKAINHF